MQTIGEALQSAGFGRRGNDRRPRKHSRARGAEGLFWQPFDPKDVARYMTAAERYERTTRAKGQRSGKLGSVALEVLRELLRLIDYRTGRLEPAIATLCDRLGRSRDAVCRALANLKAAGFLDWQRRYESTDRKNERGPQVQQTSNAYRLRLPAIAEKLLGRLWRPAPKPEDDTHRRQQAEADRRAMVATLPLWEQPAQIVDDPQLAAVLERLGRAIVERESAERTESRQVFI